MFSLKLIPDLLRTPTTDTLWDGAGGEQCKQSASCHPVAGENAQHLV